MPRVRESRDRLFVSSETKMYSLASNDRLNSQLFDVPATRNAAPLSHFRKIRGYRSVHCFLHCSSIRRRERQIPQRDTPILSTTSEPSFALHVFSICRFILIATAIAFFFVDAGFFVRIVRDLMSESERIDAVFVVLKYRESPE